ncbi:MAG: hypothetical protein GY791_13230 [Alphaproteobacteria bacterium]|nr:hypothetical protein [Alphaproteobacteria bacterium]
MMRRSTLIWFALAAVTGYSMYQLKYDVVALEEDLAKRNGEIIAYQEAIHVLKAEWAFLNRPGRLQDLAERHLDLEPETQRHEVQVSALTSNDQQVAPVAAIPTPRIKPTLAAGGRGSQ